MSQPPTLSRVDALFAGEPPPAPADSAQLVRRLQLGLYVALLLDALTLPCWTGLPGAVLTLIVYSAADAELPRVDAGQIDPASGERIRRVRRVSMVALTLLIFSLGLQWFLLKYTVYGQLYQQVAVELWERIGSLLPAEAPI
jgi:hypothetical protein